MPESLSAVLALWSGEPSVWLGVAALVCGYVAAVRPWRVWARVWARGQPGEADVSAADRPVSRSQVAAFLLGALVILFALVSPLDELGDAYLFSAHMTQHVLLTLVAPPLLLIGTPGWLLSPLLRHPLFGRVARVLTRPAVALALFNGAFMAWHLPSPYEAALHSETVHIVEHLMFMAAAVLNWWPVLSPSDERPRLPAPAQLLYLFLESVPMTILGAVIVFAPDVLYPTYAAAPRLFGLSAADDQEIAGLVMWMPGGMIYLLALTVVFFSWFNGEEKAQQAQQAQRAQRARHGEPASGR